MDTAHSAQWAAVDRYFTDLLVPPDEALEAALQSSDEAGLPPINVAPNQGKLLQLLARIAGARRILEIGTLGGYSTIWLARALPEDGCLVSLESDRHYAAVARANLERAGLGERVEVRLGRALDTLDALATAGAPPFDLVFIDADKRSNPQYLEYALRFSRPGTLIIGDNVVRNGRVTDAGCDDADVQGVRRFCEMMAQHPRLSATAIQTVGSKGWDGFSLALVLS